MTKKQNQRTIQDDIREVSQARCFDLALTKGRSNRYLPDASFSLLGRTFDIELKTCNALSGKNQVSTARGVNISKLNEWRKVHLWIFSKHENNILTGEHYVLTTRQMETFFKTCEQKLNKGSKKLAGLDDWHQAKNILSESRINSLVLEKLEYAFSHKGVALNDPKISWSYIEQNGTKITSATELRKIAKNA